MPIIGIDYEKCTRCGTCIISCSRRLLIEDGEGNIKYEDPKSFCSKCGHCIARCPENAILYEDMGETHEFWGLDKPEEIIPYEKMIKFLQAHRSIRRYKKQIVPNETLKKVFEAMQCAPTPRNMRAESFVIISDRSQLKDLSEAIQEAILNDPSFRSLYEPVFNILNKDFEIPIFFDAPHVIIVYSQLHITSGIQSIANTITYGRLAAQSLGLGTCWNGWTQLAMDLNPKVRKIAGVRGKQYGAFTIGYPDVIFYRTAPRNFKHVKGLN
jgi:nitroreductase/NAD-dependent dihydropyrimidine dehydrogenase PreA subunit